MGGSQSQPVQSGQRRAHGTVLVYVSYPKHLEDQQSARFNETGFDLALLALQEVCSSVRVAKAIGQEEWLEISINCMNFSTQLMPGADVILRCKAANLYRKYGEFRKESDQPRRVEDLKSMITFWTPGPVFASKEDLKNALQKSMDPENRCRYIYNVIIKIINYI